MSWGLLSGVGTPERFYPRAAGDHRCLSCTGGQSHGTKIALLLQLCLDRVDGAAYGHGRETWVSPRCLLTGGVGAHGKDFPRWWWVVGDGDHAPRKVCGMEGSEDGGV